MKATKKIIGIVLATALVLTYTFIPSTTVFAETPTAAEAYVQNLGAVIGEEIFKETFSKSSMSSSVECASTTVIDSSYTDVPGWEYGKSGPVWAANAPKYKIANERINYWCSYGENLLVMPAINTTNYILSVKIMRGGSTTAAAKAGIITDMKSDYTSATVGLRFGVQFNAGSSPYPVAKAITQPNSNSETATYYDPQNAYSMDNYITLTVASYNGVNYYFINEEYIANVDKRETTSERIGFYSTTTDIYLDDVSVKELIVTVPKTPLELTEEYAVNELGAKLGDVLLSETFSKSDMSSSVAVEYSRTEISSDYTDVAGWDFFSKDNAVLFANQAGKFKISGGRIEMWHYGGDSVAQLPDLDTSNYIISAKVKYYNSTQSGKLGFITDLNGDIDVATQSKRFGLLAESGAVNNAFTQISDNSDTANKVLLNPVLTANDTITLSVIAYQGVNYGFVNGVLVSTTSKYGTDNERLAIFINTSDAYFDDIVVTKLEHNVEDEIKEMFDKKVVALGEVDDNETYKVDFDYIATSNVEVGFFTADADNVNSVAYAEAKYTVNGLNDNLKEAVTYITVDKKGSSADAIGSNLYMYIIGEADVVIANATATKLTNAKGEALVANGGVAMLKDVAENENQALRYFFNYDTTTGSDIVIDGNTYKVVSRGFLLANGDVLGEEQITRTSAKTMNVIDCNTTNLTNCWDVIANGDELDSYSLYYSMYVTGFKPVNGTYNNTERLYVKGYVEVEIDGNVYTLYGEEINVTVSEVAADLG